MSRNFETCDEIVEYVGHFGPSYDVVVHTNKRVVVRCESQSAAARLAAALRRDLHADTQFKRGLKQLAWYVQAW